MRKEVEKPFKVFACIVLGLLLSALLGHPNSITVPASALLVVGNGQNTSRRGTVSYLAHRVAVQLVGGILLAPVLLAARQYLPLPEWVIVLLSIVLPLAVFFYLDYRWKISPMYITSAGIGTMILATGAIRTPLYFLTRVFLVAVGCGMGFVLSAWVLPRDHVEDAQCALKEAQLLLEDCARAGQSEDGEEMRRLLSQADARLQAAKTSLASTDTRPEIGPLPLAEVTEACCSLHHFLSRWAGRMDRYRAMPLEEREHWVGQVEELLGFYRALAEQGSPEHFRRAEAREAGLLTRLSTAE